MRRVLGLAMVGLLLAGGAACSDDDGGDSGDTTATTAGADSGDAASDVDQFCAETEELGQQLDDAIDDPTGADAAAIVTQANDLAASAAGLATANPDDADRIAECLQFLESTP